MQETINLEKQIKRHVIARRHNFFAIMHPGFEDICRKEIQLLPDIDIVDQTKGGIEFESRLTGAYAAALQMRTAGRLLMRLAQFKVENFRRLAYRLNALPWAHYLPWGHIPRFHVSMRRSRLRHSGAVAEHASAAIMTYWSQMGATPVESADQLAWIRLEDDQMTLSLDCCGKPLYQRGLKTHGGRAPLRETLAAAILIRSGFRPDRPLVDPMCGSGTFTLEAALMLKNIPPGYFRSFSFMQWPAFRIQQWLYLKRQAAQDMVSSVDQPMLFASDRDATACDALSNCLAENDMGNAATVTQTDFFNLRPKMLPGYRGEPGLIVLNPPYGRRLNPDKALNIFYADISRKLQLDYSGWRLAMLVPQALPRISLLSAMTRQPLQHGGRMVDLFIGTIG